MPPMFVVYRGAECLPKKREAENGVQRTQKRGRGNSHHQRMDSLALLYKRRLSITTQFQVKQHSVDSRNLSLLVLFLYQIQQHASLNLLSQTKDQHEHTLEKL